MGILKFGRFLVCAIVALSTAGCLHEISVSRVSPAERVQYGSSATEDGISADTRNLLANFLLDDAYENDPPALISQLEKLFKDEPRPEYLAALADCALNLGLRQRSDADTAAKFYLSAALYSYGYLLALDQPDLKPYNADRLVMIRIYNVATTELFEYLHARNLYLRSSFALTAAGGQRVTFQSPKFELPLPSGSFENFQLCADYRPENLTHLSRRFGIGAPLICQVKPEVIDGKTGDNRFAAEQTLPATLVIKFSPLKNQAAAAQLLFIDSRNQDGVKIGKNEIPLELDFSTPLAYMVRDPLPFGYLAYMLHPEETRQMQGLYMLEPYNDNRIPVVLVHGLMSNMRTWIQMINTLQNDPELRKYYQFWGFTYSSGNPVIFSAKMLRDDLLQEAERIRSSGQSMKMFSRMVLVGHSMGGLVSKMMIQNSGELLIEPLFGENCKEIMATLSADQQKFLRDMMNFEALPFVQRVVFIAVPHRGSTMATSWVGKLGSGLVQLPKTLVTNGQGIIGSLMNQGKFMPNDSKLATGIDNLDPDNKTLQVLDKIPFVPNVPYHSIIGNRREAGVPGGSDGVVPYLSSHLDGAVSELVVKSGHSVQQNPLAIQELRRILLLHLQQYPDLKVEIPQFPDIKNVE